MEESGTKLHIPLVLKHFVLFPQKLSVCGRVFVYLHQFQEQSEAMQRNPHSYQIATGYRTFYSLSLIYQPITKKRLFFGKKGPYVDEITCSQIHIDTLPATFRTIPVPRFN